MSNKSFLLVYIVIIISCIKLINSECGLNIKPSNNDIIICDNKCNTCGIICDNDAQCKNIKIYSGASTTIIECSGIDSCQNSLIFVGSNQNNNDNNESNIFYQNQYNSVIIFCRGTASCKNINVTIIGNFINGGLLSAYSAVGVDHFQISSLSVNIFADQLFQLECGENISSCLDTKYICKSGTCKCNGMGCSSLLSGMISVQTNSPSLKPSMTPSIKPTMKPSEAPSFRPTSTSPSIRPTDVPTMKTIIPTEHPSLYPTINPTQLPSVSPTINPTSNPTLTPTELPTLNPSINPSETPEIMREIDTTDSVQLFSFLKNPSVYVFILTSATLIGCILCLYFLFKSQREIKIESAINSRENMDIVSKITNDQQRIDIALPDTTTNKLHKRNSVSIVVNQHIPNTINNIRDIYNSDPNYDSDDTSDITAEDIQDDNVLEEKRTHLVTNNTDSSTSIRRSYNFNYNPNDLDNINNSVTTTNTSGVFDDDNIALPMNTDNDNNKTTTIRNNIYARNISRNLDTHGFMSPKSKTLDNKSKNKSSNIDQFKVEGCNEEKDTELIKNKSNTINDIIELDLLKTKLYESGSFADISNNPTTINGNITTKLSKNAEYLD